MHDSFIDKAKGYDADGDELVRAVQGAANETLLLAVRPVSDYGPDVARGGGLPIADSVEPAAQLESGADRAGLGPSNAGEAGEGSRLGDILRTIQKAEDFLGELVDALAPHARTEEGGEWLGVGERGGTSLMLRVGNVASSEVILEWAYRETRKSLKIGARLLCTRIMWPEMRFSRGTPIFVYGLSSRRWRPLGSEYFLLIPS
jgi:hypothetical protein